MTGNPHDKDLIRRFLASVSAYTGAVAAEMVPGVTQTDMSRWRRGNYEWITDRKREALERWLSAQEGEAVPGRGAVPARPNYAGLGFDMPAVSARLEPPAGQVFDDFVLSVIRDGHDKETVELIAEMLLCPIAALEQNTTHRQRGAAQVGIVQVRVINALIPVVTHGLRSPETKAGEPERTPPPPSRLDVTDDIGDAAEQTGTGPELAGS